MVQHAHIPDYLMSEYRGGLGLVMLLDYRTSPIGAYQELLLIPGRFQFGRRRYYTITKIYVSSIPSVTNGRHNWGIPKELADFTVEKVDARTKQFRVSRGGIPFFDATLEAGILRLPVNTIMNPFPMRLLQRHEDTTFLSTEPSAGGVVSLGGLKRLEVDGSAFPDVSRQQLLGVVEVVNFRLRFPVPEVV